MPAVTISRHTPQVLSRVGNHAALWKEVSVFSFAVPGKVFR